MAEKEDVSPSASDLVDTSVSSRSPPTFHAGSPKLFDEIRRRFRKRAAQTSIACHSDERPQFYALVPAIVKIADGYTQRQVLDTRLSDPPVHSRRLGNSKRLIAFGLFLAILFSVMCGCFFGFLMYQPLLTMADERAHGLVDSYMMLTQDGLWVQLSFELHVSVYLRNKSNLPGQLIVEQPYDEGFPVAITLPTCRAWNDSNALSFLQLDVPESEMGTGTKVHGLSTVELRFKGQYNRLVYTGLTRSTGALDLAQSSYPGLVGEADDDDDNEVCNVPQATATGIDMLTIFIRIREECTKSSLLLMEMNFGAVHMYTVAGYAGAIEHRTYPFFVPCIVAAAPSGINAFQAVPPLTLHNFI